MSSQLWWYTARSAGIVGAPGGERLVGSRPEHQGLRQAVRVVHAEQHDLATRPPTTVPPVTLPPATLPPVPPTLPHIP